MHFTYWSYMWFLIFIIFSYNNNNIFNNKKSRVLVFFFEKLNVLVNFDQTTIIFATTYTIILTIGCKYKNSKCEEFNVILKILFLQCLKTMTSSLKNTKCVSFLL